MEQAQREVSAHWLGRVAYDDAHLLQRQLVAERIEGRGIDTLLALEHDPVLTLGRNASPDHLHLTEAEYIARGIAVRHVERGGEVTYHGPGHLVVYPIIALRAGGITLREHIRALEGALIDACAAYGITAERRDGAPGCWIGERKIGAVGVRVEQGVAWHGLALNVGRDLDAFDLINPCGHAGVVSTSIAAERDWQAVAAGRRGSVGAPPPPLAEVALHVARSYATAISAYVDPATLSAMEIEVR
ncbi:MAG: lipoyl(octanoyl) transferase LipB [Candidatus Limnocylindrus sp.]